MDFLQSNKGLASKLKPTMAAIAVGASVMLTFGGISWYVGLVLLTLALCFRFGLAVATKSKDEQMEADEGKAETAKEHDKGTVEPVKKHVATLRPISTIERYPAKIKVVGLGDGGSNVITRLVREKIQGVEFIAINTDAQALTLCEAPVRLQIGEKLTGGLGVGGDHNQGQKAAEESRDELEGLVSGADMVLIICGMGGGTGTGAVPVVAEIAKKSGALTIALVTEPFTFEGAIHCQVAKDGIVHLLDKADTVIIIPNDRLLELCDEKTELGNAFKLADDVLKHGVQAIYEMITAPGLINLDFADVKAVMKDAGPAWMSIGIGAGENRAADAAKDALASPLLDVSFNGSKSVLFNVVGSSSLTLREVNEAAELIKEAADPNADIIFGVACDPDMNEEVRITLIATGFAEISQEGKLTGFLKSLKSEEGLDVPSFLRRPLFKHRRQRQDKTKIRFIPSRESQNESQKK